MKTTLTCLICWGNLLGVITFFLHVKGDYFPLNQEYCGVHLKAFLVEVISVTFKLAELLLCI